MKQINEAANAHVYCRAPPGRGLWHPLGTKICVVSGPEKAHSLPHNSPTGTHHRSYRFPGFLQKCPIWWRRSELS